MKRRDFLKGIGTLAAAGPVLSAAPAHALAERILNARKAQGLSILQGLTTQTGTQLTVDVPLRLDTRYELMDRATRRKVDPTWVRPATMAGSPMRVDKVLFMDLELGHSYQFTVKDGANNRVLDQRILSTVDLNKANSRIAVMSCMKDSKDAWRTMWPSAQAANADYYFFIGDAVYGDGLLSHGPDVLWQRFLETRATLPFYHWQNLKPVLAVWDDHDYGKNNEDGTYEHKVANLKVWKSFFGQEPADPALILGPANSFRFQAFHQSFLFLDSRYFRRLNNRGVTGFLGAEQMAWASGLMRNSAPSPMWILQGSPFFGREDKENTSYQATAPRELESFLAEVGRWNTRAVFMGGDVHYSEISRLDRRLVGYQSYEFISSCMHSGTKDEYYENPNTHLRGSLDENFLLFEKVGLNQDPSWKVSCVGENSRVRFSDLYRVG